MSSEEQANTLQLIRLLNEGGTDALRKEFNAKFPPATLAASLASRPLRTTLQTLLKNKLLNSSQWDKLYPALPGTPDSKTFDISLLYALLRNICGFKSSKDPLWTNPPVTDRSVEANIARVRWYRNDVIHNLASGVDDVAFQNYWTDICSALNKLGIPQAELDALKDSHLDEKRYADMLLEWTREEQLLLEKADEISTEVKDMKQMMRKEEGTKESVLEIRDELRQVKREVKDTTDEVKAVKQMMSEGQETSKEEVLRKLAKINFTQEMKSQAKKCHPGTREWIFSKVEHWFRDEESESRAMIILGDPGMGKTVIAAKVCQRMQTSGNLGGMHFCIHGNKRYMNAKLMLQSLANSLCNVLPAYKTALIDLLSHNLGEDQDLGKMNVKELFRFLLQEPLSEVPAPKEPFLFVIDALDEADYHGRNELMDVMSSYFARLPSWLKFLVTSRSDVSAKSKLEDLCPLEITPDLKRNKEDLELFLREKLQALVPAEGLDETLSLCLKKSQGQMLYAFCTIEYLSKRTDMYWEYLEDILPDGISPWYKHYTDRLKQDLGVTDAVYSRFLAAVVASREPLPVEMIPMLLKLKAEDHGQKIVKAIEAVSLLLPLRERKVHVFHKSFTDWLTEPQPQIYCSPKACVTEIHGHQVLVEVCSEILESLKSKTKVPKVFSLSESYALKHGLRHMLEVAEGDAQGMQLKNMVLDLEVLVLKLIHCTVYSVIEECIDCAGKVSPDVASKLEEIKRILQLNAPFLLARPKNILEHVVNEAKSEELISQAHELLEKEKYQHTWMEVINRKDGDKSGILAEIEVGELIYEFEVSPDGKMLAVNAGEVECGLCSRELSLWSVSSGKLIWRRRVDVLSVGYQQCCVFSPDGSLILFGRLDQACHLDGNIQPYFDGKNYNFVKCHFSPDGRRLITQATSYHSISVLQLWDVDRKVWVADISHEDAHKDGTNSQVNDFKFSPCGQYIASFSKYGICLWNSTGEKLDSIDQFTVAQSTLGSLDWVCPPIGDQHIFLSDCNRTRCVLKISSSKLIKCAEDNNATVDFIFSRDGKYGTAIVKLYSHNVKEQLSCCPIRLRFVCFHGMYKLVDEGSVVGSDDIFAPKTLQVIRAGDEYSDVAVQKNPSMFHSCEFSRNGNKLYTCERSYCPYTKLDWMHRDAMLPKACVYDINHGGPPWKSATVAAIVDCVFVLTSQKVLIFKNNKICQVWDGDLKKSLGTWECEQDDEPLCAAEEVVFMGYADEGVKACDVQNGCVKFTLEGHSATTQINKDFKQARKGWVDHKNSRLITTVNSGSVTLWDVDSHKLLNCHNLRFPRYNCSISSDKHKVAVLGPHPTNTVVILNELSGDILKQVDLFSAYSTCFVHGTNLLAYVGCSGLHVVDFNSFEKLGVVRLREPSLLCYDPCSRRFALTGLMLGEIFLVEVHSLEHWDKNRGI